ncbi:MAG: filamentous hemagglutinin N-terminal domain-containing protein, partial [Parachlamydiales bacterium]
MPSFLKNFLCFNAFLIAGSTLFALPEGADIVNGQADFSSQSNHLKITASDKTIINYQSFNINESEHVEFIQPSDKSTILNRVTGKDPSKILGKLSGNGRVFLVNPSGIYFGPNATVNTGSFLASTLNILDDDFLNDRFKFFQEIGSEKSSIVNDGNISVSPEGFIALFAPIIQNKGSILAHAGKVVLASSEKVAIDFSGDGLIQFTAEGDLEKALIENYGNIEAANGAVELTLRAAKKAIKMVVNADGITPADEITEIGGVIHLVSTSSIVAKNVEVNGKDNSNIIVEGNIDASNLNIGEKGGTVHVLGDYVSLKKAEINASGDIGGGEVLIGGGYQGKEEVHNAISTVVDVDTNIYCDAIKKGDGGKAIVWSDDTTYYNGQIYARGGKEIGDGGLVETSGKENLNVTFGNVNTLSANGKTGSWLMDPSSITIVRNNGNQGAAGLTTAATCTGGGFNLNDTTINNAASTVILCTAGLLRYNNNAVVNIINSGVGIQHGAASTPSSITFVTGGSTTWSIITNNGPLIFNGPVNIPTGNTMSLSTTGGNVSFASTVDGAGVISFNTGSGSTTFTGAVGGTTALTTVSVTSANITQTSTAKSTGNLTYTGSNSINVNGNITTSGGIITMTGPVAVSGSPTFDSTNSGGTATGANINFSNTLNGATNLTLRAGTAGVVSFTGAVGAINALTNLSFTSANLIQIGNNITVTGANLLFFPSPVSLTGSSIINSNNGSISFNNTLNGAQSLTITGGSGTTTFTGAVGGSTALTSLSATAATITQSSTAKTSGALSYSGSAAINVDGNITTSGGIITMTGPVAITAAPTFDTTNVGASLGGSINFATSSSTINGATSLTLRAGTAGTVSFTGAVGGSSALTNLTFTSANLIHIGNNITVTGANLLSFPIPVSLTGASIINSNNGSISFNSTLDGAHSLTITGGSGTTSFTGAIGASDALTSLSVSAATINQASTAKTSGFLSYSGFTAINIDGNITTNGGIITMTGPVALTAAPTFDTTNSGISPVGANINFATSTSTINGNTSFILTAGTDGNISFGGAIGGSSILTSLTASGATITQSLTSTTTGAVNYSGSSAINVNGDVTTSGGIITMSGPVNITGAPTFDSTNSGGTPTGADINFSSTVNGSSSFALNSGSNGNITFTGALGNSIPITSLTIINANDVIANNITASSINQIAGVGTSTFNGAINTSGALGTNLSGNNFIFNSTVNTGSNGPFDIANAGLLTLSNTAICNLSGPFNQTGAGAVHIGNSIISNNQILFTSAVSLIDNTSLTSGSNEIDFLSSIDNINGIDGPYNLTLNSGTSNITVSGDIGLNFSINDALITQAQNVTFQNLYANSATIISGTGLVTVNGDVFIGAGGIDITGNNFYSGGNITTTSEGNITINNSGNISGVAGTTVTCDGDYNQIGSGALFISGSTIVHGNFSVAGPAVLFSDSAIDLSTTHVIGGGSMTFDNTINGGFNLNLLSSGGSLSLNDNVGFTTPLGALSINNCSDLTTLGIQAASISQTASSGTTIFNGDLTTSGVAGISISTNAVIRSAAITTTGGGPLTITNNLGSFTSTAAGSITLTGNFTQNGTGSVSLAGSIATSNNNISFATPITLMGNTSLNTGSGTGNISISNTIDGAFNLTLGSGSGNITL